MLNWSFANCNQLDDGASKFFGGWADNEPGLDISKIHSRNSSPALEDEQPVLKSGEWDQDNGSGDCAQSKEHRARITALQDALSDDEDNAEQPDDKKRILIEHLPISNPMSLQFLFPSLVV